MWVRVGSWSSGGKEWTVTRAHRELTSTADVHLPATASTSASLFVLLIWHPRYVSRSSSFFPRGCRQATGRHAVVARGGEPPPRCREPSSPGRPRLAAEDHPAPRHYPCTGRLLDRQGRKRKGVGVVTRESRPLELVPPPSELTVEAVRWSHLHPLHRRC